MRSADESQMIDALQKENSQVQLISELEKKRLEKVAALTLEIDPEAQEPMRLEDLANQLEEPVRGRLLVLRQQLRQRIEQVQREAGTIRRASEALLRHMQGLVQSVAGGIKGLGTYGDRGSMPQNAMSVSTFSTTA